VPAPAARATASAAAAAEVAMLAAAAVAPAEAALPLQEAHARASSRQVQRNSCPLAVVLRNVPRTWQAQGHVYCDVLLHVGLKMWQRVGLARVVHATEAQWVTH
jgi:hypothetical protein